MESLCIPPKTANINYPKVIWKTNGNLCDDNSSEMPQGIKNFIDIGASERNESIRGK